MKKFLSLVLALAMSLSLVTVGAGAISFKDQSQIGHKEAVGVMAAAGILNGINGSFEPNGTLTREQAAKIIAYVAVGQDTAEKLGVENAPFADVAADRWSAPYVAYAAAEGIVNGVGDNKFDPTAQVTGYQFAKMLLGALDIEGDFTGKGWEVKVAAAADKADLFEDLGDVVMSKALSREHAAQMALNAMLYVDEADQWTLFDKDNNIKGNFDNKKDAYMVAAMKDWEVKETTDRSDSLLTDVHGVKVEASYDDWGVPANKYSHKDWDDALTFANEEAVEVYTKDFDKDELKDLKDDYKFDNTVVKVNGETGAYTDVDALATADLVGATIELYATGEDEDNINLIVVKQSKLAKVTAEKKDSITLSVGGQIKDDEDKDDDNFDKLSAAYDKDDYLLVYTTAAGKLIDFADAKVVSGEVTTMKTDKFVTVDGVKYELASAYDVTKSDELKVGNEYDFYLNENGNLLGAIVVEEEADLGDVYYVANIIKETSGRTDVADKYFAELVALDGSVKEVQLENYADNFAESWKGQLVTISDKKVTVGTDTYKANNDKFDLKAWSDADFDATKALTGKLAKDDTRNNGLRLNGETKYIFVERDGNDIEVSVKTGGVAYDLNKVDAKSNKVVQKQIVITEDKEVEVLYVIIDTTDAEQSQTFSKDEVVFIEKVAEKLEMGDGYYVQDVYTMDGEKLTWKVDDGEKLTTGFYSYDTNDDGYVEFEAVTPGITVTNNVWDDEDGFVQADFVSLYKTLLTVTGIEDIETKDVVFVDLHDTDDAGQYDSEIADLAELDELVDDKEIKAPELYINVDEDGAVAIFVLSVLVPEK